MSINMEHEPIPLSSEKNSRSDSSDKPVAADRRASARHSVEMHPLQVVVRLPHGDEQSGELFNECQGGIGILLENVEGLHVGDTVAVSCTSSPKVYYQNSPATAKVVHITKKANEWLVGMSWQDRST